MTAWSKTPPAALRTPCTERARARTDAASGGGWVPPLSTASWGVIWTSTPLTAAAKIRSKERLIVSVRMYVPAISATPRTTAVAVRTVRSRRSPRLRSDTRSTVLEPLHQVDDLLAGALRAVVGDRTV